jgi:succinoglycan biosynthesis protein ExoV
MKLYYYKLRGKEQNFGDNLNPWLWDRLLPDFLDEDKSVFFIGIGTLLNDRLADRTIQAKKRIIFGTGVGYGNAYPIVDETYNIYCLRGPLSARALNVPEHLAITDGAFLVRSTFSFKGGKRVQYAYMPHYELAGKGWEQLCENLGFAYINPLWPVEKVLEAIASTEVLLAEAMHGAILADALRVPWIPIVSRSSILPFKWQDWCASLGLAYNPVKIERLHHPREVMDVLTPIRIVRDKVRQARSGSELKQAIKNTPPILSDDATCDRVTQDLVKALEKLKQDWQHLG